MKLKKFVFLVSVMLVTCIPIKVVAMENSDSYYTNRNGVVMDEANYNNLVDKLSFNYVQFMTQKEYNDLKDHALDIVNQNSVIIDTIEYNGLPVDAIDPSSVSGALNGYQTASKKLSITIMDYGTNEYYVQAMNQWLKMPKVRSFDVFVMRPDDGFTIHDTTQQGTQTYDSPSGADAILYQYNGANTVRQSQGFGMSMNLVDNTTITALGNIITARVYGSSGTVSASYQHATSTVTKAQSMDYTITVNGMGGCILFNQTAVYQKYDQMTGVYSFI